VGFAEVDDEDSVRLLRNLIRTELLEGVRHKEEEQITYENHGNRKLTSALESVRPSLVAPCTTATGADSSESIVEHYNSRTQHHTN
jgi:hypothetical protein